MRFLPNAFLSRPSRVSPLCTVIGRRADFALCRLAHSAPVQRLQSCLNKQRSNLLAAAAAAREPLGKYAGC
jgi:hypothetical protein